MRKKSCFGLNSWTVATLIALVFGINTILLIIPAQAQLLPQTDTHSDPTGQITTYQPFAPAGSNIGSFGDPTVGDSQNGRACTTCHRADADFSINLPDIAATYAANPADPLFSDVDGANCIGSTNHSLLMNYGLIRVLLPIFPKTIEGAVPNYTVTVKDPNGCQALNGSPINPLVQAQCVARFGTGAQCISVWRRPILTTGLPTKSSIMWDGREPSPMLPGGLPASLTQQAIDALAAHDESVVPATSQQLADIVNFESGLYTAQSYDNAAGDLTAAGATGGPVNFAATGAAFHYGINDNHPGLGGTDIVFTLYAAWNNLTGTDPVSLARESIARGEGIFNTRLFSTGPNTGPLHTCSFCHNDPNVGNNSNGSVNGGLNEQIKLPTTDPFDAVLGATNRANLPIFTVVRTDVTHPLQSTTVSDLEMGGADGVFNDIGRKVVPTLRGVAARAPYFSTGSAPDLATVVKFYNSRFNIGLSAQDQTDLVNFLGVL